LGANWRGGANEQDPKKPWNYEELNAVLEEPGKRDPGRIAKAVPTVSAQQALDKRLLFVDDEPNIRLTLRLSLSSMVSK